MSFRIALTTSTTTPFSTFTLKGRRNGIYIALVVCYIREFFPKISLATEWYPSSVHVRANVSCLCNILRCHGNLKITQRKKLVFFGEVFKSFKHKGLKSFSTMEVVSNLINTYLTDIFFVTNLWIMHLWSRTINSCVRRDKRIYWRQCGKG